MKREGSTLRAAGHITTPAYVLLEERLRASLLAFDSLRRETGCLVLFALKSSSLGAALDIMKDTVDGFSASSPFEARLGRQVMGAEGTVHLTSPGLRDGDLPVVNETCDYLSFNSLSQWERLKNRVGPAVSCGLRVNPGISYVRDARYDPCRRYSKLGEPLAALLPMAKGKEDRFDGIEGIHFHTNCDSSDYGQLLSTVRAVEPAFHSFPALRWVNLGGGYLLEDACNLAALHEAIGLLTSYGVSVFMEPGSAIIRRAVCLVATVTDLFARDGKDVAVLDTTVNHMPEIFEYQFRPVISEEERAGRFSYTLAGSTCLAGDLFGDFRFGEPLEVGSRLVFENMGSYTLAKAHMFNGVNMPAIYGLADGAPRLIREFGYDDFLARWF